ncbi:hypothetical protein [uncultured Brevibacillus sp.]|uniref:hypothetical protein n=1 Tax=uncultured Brevibacillus sp. TaxID=169970 RepID=UPI0025967BE9|nr:hypothetical protein [uncultured Brevibacillus sp.]
MNQLQAFAAFSQSGEHVYRTSTYIQWGTSSRSLGSCLLLNPGSATLFRERPAPNQSIMGQITLDPTMQQLVKLVTEIYQTQSLDGRFTIYNLFALQNPRSSEAIPAFERLVASGMTTIEEQLIPTQELQQHPWILLGWGCLKKASWKSLPLLKQAWLQQIAASGIPFFGKKCSNGTDYYHPCPQLYATRDAIVRDLVNEHAQAVLKRDKATFRQ